MEKYMLEYKVIDYFTWETDNFFFLVNHEFFTLCKVFVSLHKFFTECLFNHSENPETVYEV